MGFTRQELESFRDAGVPDFIPENVRLLLAGINPGLWTAAVGAHFAHPSNRFYPALFAAGITRYQIDASDGFTAEDRSELGERGIGITNLVARATARAAELSAAELRRGRLQLESLVSSIEPGVVAIVGITAYRTAFGNLHAQLGEQTDSIAVAPLWVVPNPSGLNAHHQVDSLAYWFRAAADAAGVPSARPIA